MRHLVRRLLHGSMIFLFGMAIAACSELHGLSSLQDVFAPAVTENAAPGDISGVNAVRMRVAGKAMENGDHEVAARFYQTVADAVPGSIEPLLGLGEAEFARGSLDQAEAAFRAAVQLSPAAGAPNDGLGRVLVSKGAFLEAIQHFRRALAVVPSADLHNKLGVAHDLMGNGEAAQQHYRAAIALDPETVTARNNLALSLAISERYPEAVAEMERVAARPDATPRHRQNLAFIYGMAGRLQDTAKVLGTKDTPESEQARNKILFERIRALAKAGDRSAVLDFLRSATPGSSFADQMDKVPEVAAVTVPEQGLRPDEMAIATPDQSIPTEPGKEASVTAEAAPVAQSVSASTAPLAKAPEISATPEPVAEVAPVASSSERATLESEPDRPAAETEMARLAPAEQQPQPAEESAASAATVTAAVADGAQFRVQLASYRTESATLRGRKILLGLLGDRVAGLEALVRQPRKGAAGIDYRLRTGVIGDREAGTRLCTEIVAAGHPDCLVILHNPALWQPVADPVAPAPALTASDTQYRIQLASYRTEKHAVRGRAILSQLLGERFKELEILVKRGHTDGAKSIDFTIRTAPLEDAKQAAELCDAVRAAGHTGCLVIQHSESFWQVAGTDAAAGSAGPEVGPSADTPAGAGTATEMGGSTAEAN